jgi:hypothetical protein
VRRQASPVGMVIEEVAPEDSLDNSQYGVRDDEIVENG